MKKRSHLWQDNLVTMGPDALGSPPAARSLWLRHPSLRDTPNLHGSWKHWDTNLSFMMSSSGCLASAACLCMLLPLFSLPPPTLTASSAFFSTACHPWLQIWNSPWPYVPYTLPSAPSPQTHCTAAQTARYFHSSGSCMLLAQCPPGPGTIGATRRSVYLGPTSASPPPCSLLLP